MKSSKKIRVMKMNKLWRFLVSAMVLAALFAAPQMAEAKLRPLALSSAQQQGVARINAYINSFQSLKCDFAQVSSKGNLSQGTLYISKPGKLRFDYAAPNPLLIVADGRWLTIKDRVRERGDQFPLSATPLRLVVSPQIDLLAETDVVAFDQRDGVTSVSLQDRKGGMGGYITLIFDDQLNQLQQWIVVDGKDRRTTVQLSNIQFGGKFDPKLFIGKIDREPTK
jgi:outer membrane lipoprotein-sorting protein